MYYVYLLKSIENPYKFYVGYSSKEPKERLKEHNYGSVRFTSQYKPWELIYFESYKDKLDAQNRERMLKQYGNSLGHLKKRLKNSIM